jgi:hypothetical protein
MNLEEARQLICAPDASFVSRVEAATELARSSASTLDDLLACLKHRGLPAETAAIMLHKRTKRPERSDTFPSVITDHDDWAAYLKNAQKQ